jgi:formylglycine-generating enzyme required for sulfatase activity
MMENIGLAMVVLGIACAGLLAGAESPSTPPATKLSTQPAKELTLDLGNKVTMKLVQIPAGKFLMGSPETEKDRDKDETQHEVTISKPFYMDVTHVTVDQFAAFVKDSGYKTDAEKDGRSMGLEIKDGKLDFKYKVNGCSWRNPSFDQKGDHPVVQVSWNDAKTFCDWLSKKSGKTVVLPTEAQWEYACRAGTKTAYPWGDNPDDGKGWANCFDQSLKKRWSAATGSASFSWDDGFVFTSPVGSFKANAFGLYDMNGNAWQWCQDRYGDYDKGTATDPTGAATGDLRVLRGGSWYDSPGDNRSAVRIWIGPGYRHVSGGFRVVVAAGVD